MKLFKFCYITIYSQIIVLINMAEEKILCDENNIWDQKVALEYPDAHRFFGDVTKYLYIHFRNKRESLRKILHKYAHNFIEHNNKKFYKTVLIVSDEIQIPKIISEQSLTCLDRILKSWGTNPVFLHGSKVNPAFLDDHLLKVFQQSQKLQEKYKLTQQDENKYDSAFEKFKTTIYNVQQPKFSVIINSPEQIATEYSDNDSTFLQSAPLKFMVCICDQRALRWLLDNFFYLRQEIYQPIIVYFNPPLLEVGEQSQSSEKSNQGMMDEPGQLKQKCNENTLWQKPNIAVEYTDTNAYLEDQDGQYYINNEDKQSLLKLLKHYYDLPDRNKTVLIVSSMENILKLNNKENYDCLQQALSHWGSYAIFFTGEEIELGYIEKQLRVTFNQSDKLKNQYKLISDEEKQQYDNDAFVKFYDKFLSNDALKFSIVVNDLNKIDTNKYNASFLETNNKQFVICMCPEEFVKWALNNLFSDPTHEKPVIIYFMTNLANIPPKQPIKQEEIDNAALINQPLENQQIEPLQNQPPQDQQNEPLQNQPPLENQPPQDQPLFDDPLANAPQDNQQLVNQLSNASYIMNLINKYKMDKIGPSLLSLLIFSQIVWLLQVKNKSKIFYQVVVLFITIGYILIEILEFFSFESHFVKFIIFCAIMLNILLILIIINMFYVKVVKINTKKAINIILITMGSLIFLRIVWAANILIIEMKK